MDELEESLRKLEDTRSQMKVKKPGHGKTIAVIAIVIIAVAVLLAFAAVVVVQAGLPELALPISLSMPDVVLPGNSVPEVSAPTPEATPAASVELDAFPATGSYVCGFGGKDYSVANGTYFYLDAGWLVLVSGSEKFSVNTQGNYTWQLAPSTFFGSAPGALCVEDSGPQRLMEVALDTGVLSVGGQGYNVEPWK